MKVQLLDRDTGLLSLMRDLPWYTDEDQFVACELLSW